MERKEGRCWCWVGNSLPLKCIVAYSCNKPFHTGIQKHIDMFMDESTSAEGLIALLERDVQNLRTSIDKLVESNLELKNEIKEGKDEDRVYQNAIEVSSYRCKDKPK